MPERHAGRDLLVRITENPQLARAVPHLRPEVLHAIVLHQGLQDCGELLTLATAEQLSAVFDIDLWKARPSGAEEQFDDARFVEWLEVLMAADPAVAAERLAQMNIGLVVAGLSPSIAVFDRAAFSPEHGICADIGGYVIVARRAEHWVAVVDALHAFSEHQAMAFHRVMRGCRKLSDSGRELDGCDELMTDAEQARFDLAVSREQRRERLGFLSAQQAHAFLEAARDVSFEAEPPRIDTVFAAYGRYMPQDERDAPTTSVLIEELRGSGVLAEPPRALLGAGADERSIENHALNSYLQRRAGRDDLAWISTSQDLAFLTNAMVAGCFVQGRPLTIAEASDAVTATCNLGLEYWPVIWGDAAQRDLIAVFRVGWTVLHRDACVAASRALVAAAESITSSDRDLQMEMDALARELRKGLQHGAPWDARDSLDVLASLDLPTWAAMLALVAECPVMLSNVRPSHGRRAHTVDPSDFRFIASRSDVSAVHDFLGSLITRLTQ